MGNKISCKECGRRFKTLTKSKEEGLCLDCYFKKFGKYPVSFLGNAPKSKK